MGENEVISALKPLHSVVNPVEILAKSVHKAASICNGEPVVKQSMQQPKQENDVETSLSSWFIYIFGGQVYVALP